MYEILFLIVSTILNLIIYLIGIEILNIIKKNFNNIILYLKGDR